MAKKRECGGCHFDLFEFLDGKWQKTVKRKLNSRGILFLKRSCYEKYNYRNRVFLEGAARIFDCADAKIFQVNFVSLEMK